MKIAIVIIVILIVCVCFCGTVNALVGSNDFDKEWKDRVFESINGILAIIAYLLLIALCILAIICAARR